jgi:hypothetical protein
MKGNALKSGVALTSLVTLALWAGPAAATERPFRGSAELAITGATPVEGGTLLTFAAAGAATELGRFTGSAQALVNTEGTAFTAGDTTLIAANGDELYLTCAGTIAQDGSVSARCIILGGTGRFRGARGGADLVGQFHEDGSLSVDLDGIIDY